MKTLSAALTVLGFVGVCVAIVVWQEPVALLTSYISGMNVLSYAVYVLLLTVAVVLMPLTVMPLIPLAAATMGPFATAVLSIVGWTIGATIAFLISRHFGRPLLERFVSLEKIDALADRIQPDARFMVIVLLRFTIPVDIASYALGLTTRIKLPEYILATAVGVSWFSFAFAYLGEALLTGNKPLLIELGGASLLIFVTCWYLLKRSGKGKTKGE